MKLIDALKQSGHAQYKHNGNDVKISYLDSDTVGLSFNGEPLGPVYAESLYGYLLAKEVPQNYGWAPMICEEEVTA